MLSKTTLPQYLNGFQNRQTLHYLNQLIWAKNLLTSSTQENFCVTKSNQVNQPLNWGVELKEYERHQH